MNVAVRPIWAIGSSGPVEWVPVVDGYSDYYTGPLVVDDGYAPVYLGHEGATAVGTPNTAIGFRRPLGSDTVVLMDGRINSMEVETDLDISEEDLIEWGDE